ncbi:hypothetical protein GCM10009763_18060 [Dermacoccus profundi]|uniref:Uncharacterized protein n=2 Tax=Dermacoccus TaxID=57495 RepID=A0ABN2BFV3_9MICO
MTCDQHGEDDNGQAEHCGCEGTAHEAGQDDANEPRARHCWGHAVRVRVASGTAAALGDDDHPTIRADSSTGTPQRHPVTGKERAGSLVSSRSHSAAVERTKDQR